MERIIIRSNGVETVFDEEEYGDFNATYEAAVRYAAGIPGFDFTVDGEGWEGQDRIKFDCDVARYAAIS